MCAGDADECHPCIGYARRLMVPSREQQADILVQAVQNHTPDVVIVDEIGTRKVGSVDQRCCHVHVPFGGFMVRVYWGLGFGGG